jgi:hypothetical protein
MTGGAGTASTIENNKNAQKFTGIKQNIQGKVFEVNSKDAVHQFTETMKVIMDYIGQEYTHGGDIRFMVESLEDYCFNRPPNPDPHAHQYDIEYWKKQLD